MLLLLIVFVLSGFFAIGKSNNWWRRFDTTNSIDATEEFRKLYMRFSSPIHISGTIHVFDREENDKLVEETSFEYVADRSASYTRLDCLQTLFDGNLVVQIDTLNRVLSVSEADTDALPVNETAFPFERYINDTSTFRVQLTAGEEKGLRWLRIKSDLSPEIKSCVIRYDPVSGNIRETEIEWWKEFVAVENMTENKCWVTKISYLYHPVPDVAKEVKQKTDRIIRIKKKNIEPQQAYKEYTFYGL